MFSDLPNVHFWYINCGRWLMVVKLVMSRYCMRPVEIRAWVNKNKVKIKSWYPIGSQAFQALPRMLSVVGSLRLLDSVRLLLINLHQAWIYSLKARFPDPDLRNSSRCSKKGQQLSQKCKINYWTIKNHRKSHWKNAKKLLLKIMLTLQTRIAYSIADRHLV